MKEMKTEWIRNVGIVGHGGSGKTSLAEAMGFLMGETNRLGRIEDGTTISDYHSDEIGRKISISSTLLTGNWKDCKMNLIDCPGFFDFVGETKGALTVTETALIILKAFEGVEVGTEIVTKIAKEDQCTQMFIINKLSYENADFEKVIQMIHERFGHSAAVVQFPVNPGVNFDSIVDVLLMKQLTYSRDASGKVTVSEIPPNLKTRAEEYRKVLVEDAAEADDKLMEEYFDTGKLTDEDFEKGLRAGICAGKIYPILCTDATHNTGVGRLLDMISLFGPSPLIHPELRGYRDAQKRMEEVRPMKLEAPLSAEVFKTLSEPHVGEFSFIKVYSGAMKSGEDVWNSSRQVVERIGQLYQVTGKNRKEIPMLIPGDIGAVVKLKDTHTTNTLCSKDHPIILPIIEFPEPVVRAAIYSKNKGDEEKVASGLHKLHEEDPTFIHYYDAETRETIVAGQGELHLMIITNRLKSRFGVEVDLVEPKIPFKETIKGKAEGQGKYKRQSGGRGQYGDCWLRLTPQARGGGFEFVDDIVGGSIPGKYLPAIEKGVVETMGDGVIAGYPVVDVQVTCYDGTYHDVDSSDMAFKIAGSMGFKKVFQEARPTILEPIYDIAVTVPEECMGDVMGDLSSKRGKILGMETDGHYQVIKAKVPQAELYKYASQLRSMTSGRGIHTRKFSHYEEAPMEIQQKLIEDYQKRRETGENHH